MKKLLSLVLVLTMVFALAAPALALDASEVKTENMIITVQNTLKDTTYTLYPVLELVTYDKSLGAYRYVVADGLTWESLSGMKATIKGEERSVTEFLKLDTVANAGESGKQYVIWLDEESATDANAQVLAQILQANKDSLPTGTAKTATADGAEVKFEGLKAGYYLLDSTAGVLCGMNTAEKVDDSYVVTIREKNKKPTVDKKVKEGEDYIDSNDGLATGPNSHANIGDVVDYQTIIHAQPGAENYVLHDRMTEGLTLLPKVNDEDTSNTGIRVFECAVGAVTGTKLTEGVDYTVVLKAANTSAEETKCDFEIRFAKAYLDRTFGQVGSVEKDLVVYYSARVNENAAIDSANVNDTDLTYGNDNRTEKDLTETFSFDFNIYKYGVNSNDATEQKVALADAHFSLYKDVTCTTAVTFNDLTNGTYRVNTKDGAVTDLVTPGNGKLYLKGLDKGTYYLKETQAPAGYNLMDEVIKVEVLDDGTIKFDGQVHQTNVGTQDDPVMIDEIQIENRTGNELPSTGGIGTTIFYVVGLVLMAGAAILLITKKRMSASEN